MAENQQSLRVFTTKYNGLVREIINDCQVSTPYDVRLTPKEKPPKLYAIKALWDTGATGSAITPSIARLLNLVPSTKVNVQHADGISSQNVYYVNIYLPNGVIVPFVKVTECNNIIGNFEIIIGMDIIALGDFALTHVGGKTTFSFRIPSIETIDYYKEYQDTYRTPIHVEKKVGRNDPCYCGSGKKFKYCHGKNSLV
jgi:hypothetical protein